MKNYYWHQKQNYKRISYYYYYYVKLISKDEIYIYWTFKIKRDNYRWLLAIREIKRGTARKISGQ